ncbi:hypothetical protein PHMEG_00034330, partial [Phytophthora megakarya]
FQSSTCVRIADHPSSDASQNKGNVALSFGRASMAVFVKSFLRLFLIQLDAQMNCCNSAAVEGGGIFERASTRFGSCATPPADITLPHHFTDCWYRRVFVTLNFNP